MNDDKARIVAEMLEPGAVVTAVARRWQVCPQQVFGWRRAMRLGRSAATEPVSFVPIVQEAPPACDGSAVVPSPPIEVELAGAVLRVLPSTDAAVLTTVLRAIRASAR